MASLKDSALAYEHKQTMNIADLETVNVNNPVEERTGTDKNEKPYSFKVMIEGGIEYRVPNSVLDEIKKVLKLRPQTQNVKVSKFGAGLATTYKVDVLD